MKERFPIKPMFPSIRIVKEGENPKSKKARLRNHQVFLNDLASHLQKEFTTFDDVSKKLREIAGDII